MPSMEASGQKPVMTPIFLSWARPVGPDMHSRSWEFLRGVVSYLQEDLRFLPITCNVNVSDDDTPLRSIRRNMESCHGFLGIAFGKLFVREGAVGYENSDTREIRDQPFSDQWITSPFVHIEASMAFQAGIPIRMILEKDILRDGVLDDRILPAEWKMEVDLSTDTPLPELFQGDPWRNKMQAWATKVRQVRNKRNDVRLWYDA
jgi:hypothetical protein